MKITIYSAGTEDRQVFAELAANHEVSFVEEPLTDQSPVSEAEIISVFINSDLSETVLDKFPNLSLIATRSTGFDHIDLTKAEKRKITIANVPEYGSRTVAEFAFALLLTVSRKVGDAYDALRRNGQADKNLYEGFDLNNKTLGVIGTGNIGKNAVRIARGFNLKVLAFDIHPDEDLKRETGVEYVALSDLLGRSDIITLHLPLVDGTHHIINRNNINQFKPGSILINTARGGLVETAALLEALHSGRIAAAGLDVLEGEGDLKDELTLLLDESTPVEDYKILLADHELLDLPQVTVTPHIAFNTKEAKAEIRQITLNNIKAFINGEKINTVPTR